MKKKRKKKKKEKKKKKNEFYEPVPNKLTISSINLMEMPVQSEKNELEPFFGVLYLYLHPYHKDIKYSE